MQQQLVVVAHRFRSKYFRFEFLEKNLVNDTNRTSLFGFIFSHILKSETDPQMIDKKKPRSGESLGFEKKDVLLASLRVDRVSFDRINSCIMPISSN